MYAKDHGTRSWNWKARIVFKFVFLKSCDEGAKAGIIHAYEHVCDHKHIYKLGS